MPPTQQSGLQQRSSAETDSGNSKSSQSTNSRFDSLVQDLKGKRITRSKLRDEVFNILYDDSTDNPSEGKWYAFEYEPKFKDQLREWDEFRLINIVEMKKGNILGANIHYLNKNARLRAINHKKFPASTLHYYIPKNADRIFFEVQENEVPVLSQLPIEKFHRNR